MRTGRPKGSTGKNLTHQIGQWAWNTNQLHAKIKQGSPDECWTWTGSQGPTGNLFGAYKNNRNQMTQAHRIIYMDTTGLDCADISVTHRCGNKHCANPSHLSGVRPNYRLKERKVVEMIRLTISEHKFQSISTLQQEQIKSMAKEFGHMSGIDWEWEHRWMVMSGSDLLVAKIKYPDIVDMFTKRKV